MLILRDVLAWRAAEVASALDLTVATVNSLLQRARQQVKDTAPQRDSTQEPDDAVQRETLARYVAAFQDYDVDAIVEMFTAKSIWEMPPFTGWYEGGEAIGTLIRKNCPAEKAGDQVLLPTVANGQPAYGLYMLDKESGEHLPFQLQVLELSADGRTVDHAVVFFDDDTEALFARFGLPARPPATDARP